MEVKMIGPTGPALDLHSQNNIEKLRNTSNYNGLGDYSS